MILKTRKILFIIFLSIFFVLFIFLLSNNQSIDPLFGKAVEIKNDYGNYNWNLESECPSIDSTPIKPAEVDGNWCNGLEVCREYNGPENIKGYYWTNEKDSSFSAIESYKSHPSIKLEPELEFNRFSPKTTPLISESGNYAYLSTNRWIDIINLNSNTIIDNADVPNYDSSSFVNRIDLPSVGFTVPSYEGSSNLKSKDYIYSGWGNGKIAKIDVTNPNNPIISSSPITDVPPQLIGAKIEKIVIVGDYVIGQSESIVMESMPTWSYPKYINVWDKNTLEFKGAVAIYDGHNFDNSNLEPEGYNQYSANFEGSSRWPFSFTEYLSTISVIDDKRIIFVNQDHSLNIVNLGNVDWTQEPIKYCFGSQTLEQGCPYAEFFVEYPEYQCFMDNYVDSVNNNNIYNEYTIFKNSLDEARCSKLYSDGELDLFHSIKDWGVYLNPTAITLPNGKKMVLLSGGNQNTVNQPAYMTLMNLNPLFENGEEPEFVKIIKAENVPYLNNYAIDENTICGDFVHYGGWYASIQCWRIYNENNEYEIFPLGALMTPWNVHTEFIFSPSISSNERYLVGGDKNLIAFDFSNSFLSEECEEWATVQKEEEFLVYDPNNIYVDNIFEVYPDGVYSGHEALYNSPCSKRYKKVEGSIVEDKEYAIDREPSENMEGLLGIYFPDYITWPHDTPIESSNTKLSFIAEWLSGAKILWKDIQSGDIKFKSIPISNPFYSSVAGGQATSDGENFYLWGSWNNKIERFKIGYDPRENILGGLIFDEPVVEFSEEINTDELINGMAGGYYEHNTGNRYVINGRSANDQYTRDSAKIFIYDLNDQGSYKLLNYDPSSFVNIDDDYNFVELRTGYGEGGYYYAPLSFYKEDEKYSKERIYLLTIDMNSVITSNDLNQNHIVSIIPLSPSNENAPDSESGKILFEMGNSLRVDPIKRIGIFIAWNAERNNHPTTFGTLVDFSSYNSRGERVDNSWSSTPKVVRSFYQDWDPDNPRSNIKFVFNGKTHVVHFNVNGYTNNGYWYFRTQDGAVAVYRSIISNQYSSDPYRIDLQPIGVFEHEDINFYRHISFIEDRGVVVSPEGSFSFPLCVDNWGEDSEVKNEDIIKISKIDKNIRSDSSTQIVKKSDFHKSRSK